jgi:hypothetical protein
MVTALQESGVWFGRSLPSGSGVGALGVVAFAAGLAEVAGLANALQLRRPIVISLGLDVVTVSCGSHAA